ncbi:hypothetical protein J3Q64DRAFT_1278276 [Phycomyces blakesleeanus]|uniref:Uncharacterized protein n=1 Tax=Phycomyces blakesleeanus TaxID=4837 RepID=A0ABR3ANF8_PHYBL
MAFVKVLRKEKAKRRLKVQKKYTDKGRKPNSGSHLGALDLKHETAHSFRKLLVRQIYFLFVHKIDFYFCTKNFRKNIYRCIAYDNGFSEGSEVNRIRRKNTCRLSLALHNVTKPWRILDSSCRNRLLVALYFVSSTSSNYSFVLGLYRNVVMLRHEGSEWAEAHSSAQSGDWQELTGSEKSRESGAEWPSHFYGISRLERCLWTRDCVCH